MIAAGCDPQAAAEFLRALGHPMRLQILCRLLDGETQVAGFETELGLKQPNLSQQLGLLREAGLVTTRREAKSIFYSLADEKVRTVMAALRTAFGDAQPVAQPKPVASLEARVIRLRQASQQAAPVRSNGECGVFSVAGWPTPKARDLVP